MQKSITIEPEFGFDGAHANGQPFRVDVFTTSSEVAFGQPVFADGDKVKADAAGTANTYVGMAVGPHQHVQMKLPDDQSANTAQANEIIAVAKRGTWYTSWNAALEGIAVGSILGITAGKYAIVGASGVAVAEVVALSSDKKRAAIRLIK